MSEHAPNQHIAPRESLVHGHAATPASEHAHAENAFTDLEWASFRAEDFAAGKAVVLLMLGIFSTGVVLYTIVAYAVIS